MFEETQTTSLDLEDLLLAVIALLLPPGAWLFDRVVPGTKVFAAAVVASGLVSLRLMAGGQLLGSARRALVGGGFWLSFWCWQAFGRPALSAFAVSQFAFGFVKLFWVLAWLAALVWLVRRGSQWRKDDRGLAGAGLFVLALVQWFD